MKRFSTFLIFLCLQIFVTQQAFSSHLAGADITFVNVGNDEYRVTLAVYGDCSGVISLLGNSIDIDINSNSCSISETVELFRDTVYEVSAICPNQLSNSECSGGSLQPAYSVFIYSSVVTLTPCTDWVLSYQDIARNNGTDNISNTSSLYVETTANLVAARNNSSAQFFAFPTPTFYVGTIGSYNNASYDPNRDSLYYELVEPRVDPTTPCGWRAGYSTANPILSNGGMAFSPRVGLIGITPSTQSLCALAMKVTEYRAGVAICSVIRDVQVNIGPPTNNSLPQTGTDSDISLENIVGGYKIANVNRPTTLVELDSINSFTICPGDSLNLEITIRDFDNSQVFSVIKSNASLAIPNSTIRFTQIEPNVIKANFEWLASTDDIGYNVFSIIVGDNECPLIYKSYFTYNIEVRPSIEIGEDIVICGINDTAILNIGESINGLKSAKWHFISGDSIKLGENFLCDTCPITKAWPKRRTTYYVETKFEDGTFICKSLDTITIIPIPVYSLSSNVEKPTICREETTAVSIFAAPAIGFDFNYKWTPADLFSDPTAGSTSFSHYAPGRQAVVVEVNYNGGCIQYDTVYVNVSNSPKPNIEWLNTTNIIPCPDSTYAFNIRPGKSAPISCRAAGGRNCQELPKQTDVGESNSLTNNPRTYPAPFTLRDNSSKYQFLYKSNELFSSGMSGGKLTALSLFVRNLNQTNPSQTLTVENISVKMSCTSLDALPTDTFLTGLYPVYGSPLATRNYSISKGWNQIDFDVAFEWDGFSNIVVEICMESPSIQNNPSVILQDVNYKSGMWSLKNDNTACSDVVADNPSSNRRAYIRFKHCDLFPNSNLYSYSWKPTTPLNDPTLLNPIATINSNETFTLVMTDKVSSCSDSMDFDINIGCCTKISDVVVTDSLCATNNSGEINFFISGNRLFKVRLVDLNRGGDTIRDILTPSNFSANNLFPGKYLVYITDSKECLFDTTLEIRKFYTDARIVGKKPICPDSTVSLRLTGSSISNIVWSNGTSGPQADLGVGPFTVEFDFNGCRNFINDTVLQSPLPISSFTVNPSDGAKIGQTIVFTYNGANGVNWTWGLGGGSTPTNQGLRVSNNYDIGGEYIIQLITRNSDGCSDTSSTMYKILEPLGLPNVITPNGDGKNDKLVISELDDSLFNNEIIIYNRWGRLVYKASNYDNEWGGEGLEKGTYFYIITLDDTEQSIFKGYFELLK